MKKRAPPPPPRHRLGKHENYYYNTKKKEGFGGARLLLQRQNLFNTREWLRAQPTYTLHKDVKRNFPTRKYITGGINDLWQADLMEMIPYSKVNKGYKYILNIIDVFSRYVWAIPLKKKSASEVTEALERTFNKVATLPRHLQTDQGKEFYNSSVQKLLKHHNINHYSVYSKQKCAHVERFNRTLRAKLNRYFTFTGKKIWFNSLDDIIHTYNKTPHRGIYNMSPVSVNTTNEMDIWLRNSQQPPTSTTHANLKIHDHCRISRDRGIFLKNFDQNWSEEIFQIVAIDSSASPVMYYLCDLKGEQIKGKFYKQELQVVAAPSSVYRIEKVLQTRGRGRYKQHLVKWYGYNEQSWIPANAIIKSS
jgi:transposase InsO family protein